MHYAQGLIKSALTGYFLGNKQTLCRLCKTKQAIFIQLFDNP